MSRITVVRKPVYDPRGVLVAYRVTRYTPRGVTAPAARPVTLESIRGVLTTALADWDRAWEERLASYSQRAVAQAEQTHLGAQLQAYGFTAQDCASMPLPALRKVVQIIAQGQEADMPDDTPAW